MTEKTLQARADAIALRMRKAMALLDTADMDDLRGVQGEISALCKAAQAQGDAPARTALQTALDALADLDEAIRQRRDAVQEKLSSSPNRKRAISAYGRGTGG